MPSLRQILITLGVSLAFQIACGGKAQDGTSGGKTSWLARCTADSDCNTGVCSNHACTVTCSDDESCAPLANDARCASVNQSSCAAEGAARQVCAKSCDQDRDCAAIGEDYACNAGVCGPDCSLPEPIVDSGPGNTDCVDAGRADGDVFGPCNNCTCNAGQVVCTEETCHGTCEVAGTVYEDGETWGACSEFGCTDGQVTANPIACTRCEYQGQVYDSGDNFGECGECSCSEGEVACAAECPACLVDGISVPYGETYPANDTCNTCSCGGGCTQIGCGTAARCVFKGTLYASGQSVGECDECLCNDGQLECDEQVANGCSDAAAPDTMSTSPSTITASSSTGDSSSPDGATGVPGAVLDGGQCLIVDDIARLSLNLARGYIELPPSLSDFEAGLTCTDVAEGSGWRLLTGCGLVQYATYTISQILPEQSASYTFDGESGDLLFADVDHSTSWGPCNVKRYNIGDAPSCDVASKQVFCQVEDSVRDGG
ncbi:MAG TPA: hypothetical protein VHM70_27875 [Polyangiaceae bacterium]|nr:hypothetical protein [Polyangiaceae bacterium]